MVSLIAKLRKSKLNLMALPTRAWGRAKVSAGTVDVTNMFGGMQTIDNKFAVWVQRFPRPNVFTVYLAGFITALYSPEILLLAPCGLYFAGLDSAGFICGTYALCAFFLSQIPKRFLWRDRPYMQTPGVLRFAPALTSSLPSRAVTISINLVTCIADACAAEGARWPVWLFVFMIILNPVLATWARCHLGAHFLSDCLLGILQGLIIFGVASGTQLIEEAVCNKGDACYGGARSFAAALAGAPPAPMLTGAGISLLLLYVAMMAPVRFFVKAHYIIGLTAAYWLFDLGVACKGAGRDAIARPRRLPAGEAVGCVLLGLIVGGFFMVVAWLCRPRPRRSAQPSTLLGDDVKGLTAEQALGWTTDGRLGSLGNAWPSLLCGIVCAVLVFFILLAWRTSPWMLAPL